MGRLHRRGILIAALVGAASGCAAATPTPTSALPPGSHLTVRLVMRTPAGTPRPVELAQPVFTGDQLALELTGAGVGQVRVFLGKDLKPVHAGPLANAPLRIPAGQSWLELAGVEAVARLLIVASPQTLDEAAARERAQVAQKRTELDERIVAIDPAYAASRRPGPTQVTGPRRTFRLRGPWLVEDPSSGGVRAEAFPEDDDIVVELRIQTDRARR